MWYCIQTVCSECCSKTQPSVMLLGLYISMNHLRYGNFVTDMQQLCGGHSWREQSVNALFICSYFQLLFKDSSLWLGSYSRVDNIRTQPFFRVINWHALQEERVKQPEKPEIVEVSSTNRVFISCHKQLLLTSQGNLGNKSIITSTTVMKNWRSICACAHRHVHACLFQYIV